MRTAWLALGGAMTAIGTAALSVWFGVRYAAPGPHHFHWWTSVVVDVFGIVGIAGLYVMVSALADTPRLPLPGVSKQRTGRQKTAKLLKEGHRLSNELAAMGHNIHSTSEFKRVATWYRETIESLESYDKRGAVLFESEDLDVPITSSVAILSGWLVRRTGQLAQILIRD